MPNDHNHWIDLKNLIEKQKKERYRSVLILFEPNQNASKKARKLSEKINGQYFDLLDYFESRSELCERIDRFGIDELEDLLVKHPFENEIVVVDRIDFLFDTWSGTEREAFVDLLLAKRLDKFERDVNLFVFFAVNDVYLRQNELVNEQNESRILKLSEVLI